MSSEDVRCSSVELRLLRPLDQMAPSVRLAVTRWLWQHDITPSTLAVGLDIERDDAQHLLVWRERLTDGAVVKRWRYAPREGVDLWPAPFPADLVDAGRRPERTERVEQARTGH